MPSSFGKGVKLVGADIEHSENVAECWNTINAPSGLGITVVVNIHIANVSALGIASIVDPVAGDITEEGMASHITDSLNVVNSAEKV